MSATRIEQPTGSKPAPFGTEFGETMSVARHVDGAYGPPSMETLASFTLHPGTHSLHYGSSCFEGLKAHRQPDGSVAAFRVSRHAERLKRSAERLMLPVPSVELFTELIEMVLDAHGDLTPDAPGAMYLRPTLLGTDMTIGAAAYPSASSILYVLASPVGEYLPGRPLTIAVETKSPRTTPQFGVVKTGANYAMALTKISEARNAYGADQVLFAPGGIVEETGASNVILVDGTHIVTPALTESFLHGVTRDSLLQIARADGWTVEEREVSVDECVAWASRPTGEIALTGTAAVLASVGTLVVDGQAIELSPTHSAPSSIVTAMRRRLTAIQGGREHFTFQ